MQTLGKKGVLLIGDEAPTVNQGSWIRVLESNDAINLVRRRLQDVNNDLSLLDGDFEYVVITTSNKDNYSVILGCIERKKHVLLEPPLMFSAEEVEKLQQMLSKNKSAVLEVDHHRAFFDIYQGLGEKSYIHGSVTEVSNLTKFSDYIDGADKMNSEMYNVIYNAVLLLHRKTKGVITDVALESVYDEYPDEVCDINSIIIRLYSQDAQGQEQEQDTKIWFGHDDGDSKRVVLYYNNKTDSNKTDSCSVVWDDLKEGNDRLIGDPGYLKGITVDKQSNEKSRDKMFEYFLESTSTGADVVRSKVSVGSCDIPGLSDAISCSAVVRVINDCIITELMQNPGRSSDLLYKKHGVIIELAKPNAFTSVKSVQCVGDEAEYAQEVVLC